jgi:predicted enzyme related to lactoylglutathione lyase
MSMRSALVIVLLLIVTGYTAQNEGAGMKISFCSVFVEDQAVALEFYTNILGFQKKEDLPAGEFRWLTVVSPEAPDGAQLVLEPNVNAAAREFQAAIREQGIPATSFGAVNVQKTYKRLSDLGVKFTVEPTEAGSATIAIFDDTCGNLIQIHQEE